MPSLDKNTEKRVVSFLREINLMLVLERHTDEVKRIKDLVERMPALEREIINRKYLDKEADYVRHYEIYRDLMISEGHYAKVRLRGLQKIAAEFGLFDAAEKKSVVN